MDGNVFGHGHHKRNLRLDGLFNGLGSLVSWYVDSRSVRLCLFLGLDTNTQISMQDFRPNRADLPPTTLTEGKTGSPRCSPSTPGLTPPTILVPHSRDSLTLAVACRPVEKH